MQPKRKFRIKWFRLVVVLTVIYSGYVLISQQLELNAIKRETEATNSKVEQLKQKNISLNEEKARLQTPAYVEKIAREELGLAKPGEVPYVSQEKNNQ